MGSPRDRLQIPVDRGHFGERWLLREISRSRASEALAGGCSARRAWFILALGTFGTFNSADVKFILRS
jgi:hypothetical protein